jgi:hypothetical protein
MGISSFIGERCNGVGLYSGGLLYERRVRSMKCTNQAAAAIALKLLARGHFVG